METNLQKELSPEELRKLGPDRLLVRVRSIIYQGEHINAYEVVNPEHRELPPFTAGSHIDLYFRDGRVRQYSLCNDPRERHRYVFAVQREPLGRGGSKAIFERVHVGRILTISGPRNNFPLAADANQHLFIAGGIGITPIMSMIHRLAADGAQFILHYCARTSGRTAFMEELRPLQQQGKVFFHHDGGDPSCGLNFAALLRVYEPGTHLYFCGPSGVMAAIKKVAAHWPAEMVHYEYFTPPTAGAQAGSVTGQGVRPLSPQEMEGVISVGFQVKIVSTGAIFDVPNDKSIAQVLREHGIQVPTSCESGLCGTCRTRYLEGIPDHRDYILDDEEKTRDMLICCSRSKTPLLVLDL